MTTAPLFSVIVPCYNAANTLQETIRSVQAQTLTDWELIVVDDGSIDESLELLQELALDDQRIRLQRNSHQGVSWARNTGVSLAAGRYLAFLDADDLWHPNKLSLHADHFNRCPKLGISFARVQFMTPCGKLLPQVSAVPKKGLDALSLLTENHISTSSNIVALREIFTEIGGFQNNMSFAEDQEWLFRVAIKGTYLIAGIPQILVQYRTSQASLSSNLERMEAGWREMLTEVGRYAPEFLDQHYQAAQAIYLRYLARRALRQGEPAQTGLTYLRRAWRCSPFSLLRQPHRSLMTYLALLAWQTLPRITNRYFLHLNPNQEF